MRRILMTLVIAAGLAWPAEAGLEYRARTWQEGQQASDAAASTVKASVDGDKARIEFEDSGNPWMPAGSYLLTSDAGQTIYLVKPEDKTYGKFDLDAIMQMVGAITSSGLIDFDIENPKVETLASGPGKTVAGLATKHARYRTSYDMRIKILGMGRMQHIETVQDIWYTDSIGDPAMAVWLRREPPRTNSDLDQLIDLEISKIRGFPLEAVETSTTTGKKGKESTTTLHMQVTDLRQGVSFVPGTFVIPPDYTETQLMPTEEMMAGGEQPGGEGEEPEEEEKKGGLFGRLKKLGKKDGG